MTRDKWAKMNPDEKLTKIAELCGWTEIEYGWAKCGFAGMKGTVPEATVAYATILRDGKITSALLNQGADNWYDRLLPDYLNDLNIMYELEKMLDDEQWVSYSHNLTITTWTDLQTIVDKGLRQSIAATAEQRAEAFVLAMEE